jgi:hypothetical protein
MRPPRREAAGAASGVEPSGNASPRRMRPPWPPGRRSRRSHSLLATLSAAPRRPARGGSCRALERDGNAPARARPPTILPA